MTTRTRTLLCAAALAWSASGFAEDYPQKAVTIVVPAVAGGVVDVLARSLAEEMGKRMGQAVIVDNKPGASGMLATQAVARAKPDGYTVLVTYSTPIMNAPYMFSKVAYDVRRDLSFVSQICTGQLVLAVNAKMVPATTMKDFVAWAAKSRGSVSYGSYGVGTGGHLMGAYLSQSRDLEMTHVAYKGEPPMLQDLVGGQIAWAMGSAGSLLPHFESGRLRPLAVLGDRRIHDIPQVPTMAEAGFPDPEFKTTGWIAMMAPAGVPPAVLARLEKEAIAAAQTTTMKARYQAYGMDVIAGTAADFRRDFETTAPLFERLIKSSGAKAD
ncbi:MAG: tripartite tricarboxylate transporter substrate binding protein [Variovorax sp.]|nr:MAG: tripartite tricarboxylate transporter substrate binding protein [Variovorax sp.]